MNPSFFGRPKFIFDEVYDHCVDVLQGRLSKRRVSDVYRMSLFYIIGPRGAARACVFGVSWSRIHGPRIFDRWFNREGVVRYRRIFRYFRDGFLLRFTIFMGVNVYMLLEVDRFFFVFAIILVAFVFALFKALSIITAD